MTSFIATTIKEMATERITYALENGDAIREAKNIREEIREAWLAALDASGVPDEIKSTLSFPL